MIRSRAIRVVRGIASLLVTLALLVGVPVVLAKIVGWPLPTRIPDIDDLERAARAEVNDQLILDTLAILAWIVWAQIAVAVLVETVAVARHRPPLHLPVLPDVQRTAARLVTGILMIASTAHPARAYAGPPPVPVIAEVTIEAPIPTIDAVVASLGVPARTGPDGTAIAADDDTLDAGIVLVVPIDTVASSVAASPSEPAPPLAATPDTFTVVVQPGDNLWTIVADHLRADLGRAPSDLEVEPYWRAVINTNHDRYVQPGNPNLILPGQVLVLPPTGAAMPAREPADDAPGRPERVPAPTAATAETGPEQPLEVPVTATTTAPSEADAPPSTAEVSNAAPADAGDAKPDDAANESVPLAVVIGGLSSVALAVGLKRLLRRRLRRFTTAHDGQPPRIPPDQRELHQAVVTHADEDRIDDLQGVLGWLASTLAQTSSARRPRVIRHGVDSLEVLLDHPEPSPPAGWTSTDDGTIWTLHEGPDLDDPYDGPLSPAPLLVTVGQPDQDAQLYLDLEVDGLLALTGNRDVATNLARSIVTELALSPLTQTLRVIAIGDVVDPDAAELEHLTVVDSWDGIVEDLEAWARQSHDALVDNDWANPFVARGHEPDHDALTPVAVVADRPPPPELAKALRAGRPSTVAVVVIGAFDAAVSTIRCEADALNFDSIGLACTPQSLEVDDLTYMCRLVAATGGVDEQPVTHEHHAQRDATASPNGSRHVDEPAPVPADQNPAARNEPPSYDVLVRLLGDITVEGGTGIKPKASSVVAYLALHRSVTTERLDEACWFGSDGTTHRKRLRDVMTDIRDALGSQHFPPNRNGSYAAGPHVRTDLELFDWHVQRAAALEPSAAIDEYRAALDLVTGKPFSYPNAARASYGWVDLEHHATTWEYRIAHVAQACAEMHLDAGKFAEAIDMLRGIIQATPLNSTVVEALMRAYIANSDRAGAEHVYQEHAAALDQAKLGDPADALEQLRIDLHANR